MIAKTMPFSLGQKLQRTHVSKKIIAANEVMQHATNPCLFSSCGEGCDVQFLLFPICSHCIPIKFLNMFPIAPHFISHPLP
jgi:hypothetical protein